MLTDNTEAYTAMLPFLDQACFGSYLILPFRFLEGDLRFEFVRASYETERSCF